VARPPTAETSTIHSGTGEEIAEGTHPVAMWARRGMLAAMALVVIAGLLSWLGVHTSSATAEGNGYRMTLHYPSVARAGLDTPWQVTVTHRGGFGKLLTIAVTGDYFNIFETQGFHPQPADETRDGHNLYLTFTAPPGDTFVVDFDAYIQPSSQRGDSATVAVVKDGTTMVSLDYHTRLMP
jgi:hypothetical protein